MPGAINYKGFAIERERQIYPPLKWRAAFRSFDGSMLVKFFLERRRQR